MKSQILLILLLPVFLLAACGGQEAVEPTAERATSLDTETSVPAMETAAPLPTETSAPEPEVPTEVSPSVVVEEETQEAPTLAPAAEPDPAATSEPTEEVEEPAAAQVISGQTAEGAYFYGNPDAAVTLFDYSDFL